MRVNFIIKDIGINGGTKDIIMFANGLTKLNHEVNIIYPKWIFPNLLNIRCDRDFIKNFSGYIIRFKREILGTNLNDSEKYQNFFPIEAKLLKVKKLSEKYIPDADVVFATWWETAYYVKKLSKKKGRKFYLIQHYETWGGRKSRVDKTYKMGFVNIVHSSWLKETLLKEVGVKADALILHAPDHKKFYPEKKKKEGKDIKVMILYRNVSWKGSEDGIKAFELAKKENPNLKLLLVGKDKEATPDELRGFYNEADIFLFPSHIEGFGLPPLEAMCCKTAVISTDVGAVRDYGENGKNMIIVKPQDIKAMAEAILKLSKNKRLRDSIAREGLETTKSLTWENQTKKLEEVIKNN